MSKSQKITNRFFCINCGQEGIPLARSAGKQREKHHRKKLWCYSCKQTLNHIECKNSIEVMEFQDNFKKGVYVNEAKESMDYVRAERSW